MRTDEDGRRRRSRRWLWLILLLLIGAGLGWWANDKLTKENNSSPTNASSQTQKSNTPPNDTQKAILKTAFSEYAQMLVEASREGVDAPSEEATAAKQTLTNRTDAVVQALSQSGKFKNTDGLKEKLLAVNNGFLAYASTARGGDNHQDLDKVIADLGNYARQNANQPVKSQEFLAGLTSFKNTALGSVRDFVNKDFQGSYDKQLQAEAEAQSLVNQLY
jgi:hypothetical protein